MTAMRIYSYILSLVLFVSLQTVAFAVEPLAHFGNANPELTAVPQVFRVLNWNVHKGSDKGLPLDFARISQNVHFNLFQEAIENTLWIDRITQVQPGLRWSMVRSFYSVKESEYHGYTGVGTGSMVAPVNEIPLISPVTEPISNTRKTVLLTEYKIENSPETLLVINVHMINFVGDGAFTAHLRQIVSAVKDHTGPIVMAGDFNTWSDSRIAYLARAAKLLGVERVPLDNYYNSPIIYPYDHIFTRGLIIREAHSLEYIKTSDHMPLLVELEIKSPAPAPTPTPEPTPEPTPTPDPGTFIYEI